MKNMTKVQAAMVVALDENLSGVRLQSHNLPQPAADEVQVEVKAVALNFPDLLMCSGGYQFKPDLPFAVGMEAAGIVREVGSAVSPWRIGDEVLIAARSGLSLERVNVAPAQLTAKPAAMSFPEAAAFRVAWITALTALSPIAGVGKGDSLLVLGAGGGVGIAAVDVGVKLGARVMAVASSDEKRKLALSYGAAEVFAPDENLPALVKAATKDKGVGFVYDPVGGAMFQAGLRCLGWGGKMLVIGFASGERPTLAVNYALIKGLSVIGVRAGEFARQNPAAGRALTAQLMAWAEAGEIKPPIGRALPLAKTKEALQLLQDRKAVGKIVLTL